VTGTIAIVQPAIPDYRLPLFDSLARIYGSRLCVYAGAMTGSNTIATVAQSKEYFRPLRNRFLFKQTLLWQSGHESDLLDADLLILSGSLRTLSGLRLLQKRHGRKPTLLWGHVGGRHTSVNVFRRWMLQASDGFISYTDTDAAIAKTLLRADRVWNTNNSCVWKSDCVLAAPPDTPPSDVLYVGRLVAEKKPHLLLDAFAMLISRELIPGSARLVFVGTGPLREKLEQRAVALGIQDRTVFHGHVWRSEDLWPIYDRALVATSPGYVGLSVIQAFARGVTMVVSAKERHSPEIEACRSGFNTFFFETDSTGDLAKTLQSCYSMADVLVSRRPTIAHAISTRYTYDAMIAAFQTAIDTFTE